MSIYIWGQYLFSRMYKSIFYYFYIHSLLYTVAMQNLRQSRDVWLVSEVLTCVQQKRMVHQNGCHCTVYLTVDYTETQRRIQQSSSYNRVHLVWLENVIVNLFVGHHLTTLMFCSCGKQWFRFSLVCFIYFYGQSPGWNLQSHCHLFLYSLAWKNGENLVFPYSGALLQSISVEHVIINV